MLIVTYKPFMLSVVMQSAVKLSVVMLSVVMLSVVTPVTSLKNFSVTNTLACFAEESVTKKKVSNID
jgi:hypothetical protein